MWRSGLLALCLAATQAGAAPLGDPAIEGVLADHTRTPAGHLVFRAFQRAWQDKGAHAKANLVVQEYAAPHGGTTITIEHERQVVFRAPGSGARSEPERVAQAAVDAVVRHFAQESARRSPDLDPRNELN